MDSKVFQKIISDFSSLLPTIDPLGIVVFGSHAQGKETRQSDIDICVIKPKLSIVSTLSEIWKELGGSYDVKVFEELPVYLQAEVIEKHVIVYVKSELEFYEYLYPFRKHIETYKYRLKVAYEEN